MAIKSSMRWFHVKMTNVFLAFIVMAVNRNHSSWHVRVCLELCGSGTKEEITNAY
jgi:hypothetical protein